MTNPSVILCVEADCRAERNGLVGQGGPRTAAEPELDERFEALYLDAWLRLYRYTWLLLRHREDAEDVAAETIRRAYASWKRGRGPRGEPLAWLFLIARRLVVDSHRKSPIRWLPISPDDEAVEPRSSIDEMEAAVWFDQLRSCLTPRQHEAVLLRYLFDFSDEQIGQLMGLSRAGVRTNVSRALAALRARPEVFS
jgi:RNA polymerase sigma-70 factor (ECF subfamily)